MTEPAEPLPEYVPPPHPGGPPGVVGYVSVVATATVVHPPGADLSALPDPTPVAGNDGTENP